MAAPLRYRVSRHERLGDGHWDLFAQADPAAERLPTWRLSVLPWELPVGVAAPAERIFDHRSAYLDWVGELSDGRGSVTPIEAGTLEWLSPDRADNTGPVLLRLTRPTGEVLVLALPRETDRLGEVQRLPLAGSANSGNPARPAT